MGHGREEDASVHILQYVYGRGEEDLLHGGTDAPF